MLKQSKAKLVRVTSISSKDINKIFLLDLTPDLPSHIRYFVNNIVRPRLRPLFIIPKLNITNQRSYSEYRKQLTKQGIVVANWKPVKFSSSEDKELSDSGQAFNKLAASIINYIDLTLLFSSLVDFYGNRSLQINKILKKIITTDLQSLSEASDIDKRNVLVLFVDPYKVSYAYGADFTTSVAGRTLYYASLWLETFDSIYTATIIAKGQRVWYEIVDVTVFKSRPKLLIQYLNKTINKFISAMDVDLSKQNSKQLTLKSIITSEPNLSIDDEPISSPTYYLKASKNTLKEFEKSVSNINVKLNREQIPEAETIQYSINKHNIPAIPRAIISKPDSIVTQNKKEQYDSIIPSMVKIIENQGIKVTGVEIQQPKVLTDNKATLVTHVKLYLQYPDNTTDILVVNLPQLIDNYYFYVNGQRKLMSYQFLSEPITIVKPYTVHIHTMYQVSVLQYNPKKNTSKLYTVGVELNPAILFMVHQRYDFFKLFGYDIQIQ